MACNTVHHPRAYFFNFCLIVLKLCQMLPMLVSHSLPSPIPLTYIVQVVSGPFLNLSQLDFTSASCATFLLTGITIILQIKGTLKCREVARIQLNILVPEPNSRSHNSTTLKFSFPGFPDMLGAAGKPLLLTSTLELTSETRCRFLIPG